MPLTAFLHKANQILKKEVLLHASQDKTATVGSIESSIQTVTPSWARHWVSRQPMLREFTPRRVELDRSEGCRKSVIEAWFETWKKEVANEAILPAMLANFDETMIQPQVNARVKVVGFQDSDAVVVCKDPELPHITLGVTIFADGTHTDHLLIYPSKFVPQELRGENSAEYIGYSLAGQDSGWINQELFAQYCRQTIIPAFEERRAKLAKLGVHNAVGVLLVDGHSSRLNSKLMEEFNEHNIKVPVLPSHASLVLQPLDLAVFGAFKSAISKGDSSLRQLTLPERRAAMMKKARNALYLALSPGTVITSWKRSGLHPFDPQTPLQHPCVLLSQEDEPLKIDNSGKGQGQRYHMSGKVITNLAELEAIRMVEQRKSSRAQPKYSQDQVPNDTLLMTDPEKRLPPLPKRRGRPPKSIPSTPAGDPSMEAH